MSLYDKYKKVLQNDLNNIDVIMPSISVFMSRIKFTKMLEQYEIFKLVKNRPGHIVEIGVYRGESFFHFARFVEIFNIGERETKVIGFDNFSGFANVHEKDRSKENLNEDSLKHEHGVKIGGFDPGTRAYERILELIDIFEADHFVPNKKRLEIVKGNVLETIPKFVKENPGVRISLLHLDVDLYEPTLCALKYLYPLVVSGGVVILDEYGQEKFAGESQAFDEYFPSNRPKVIKSNLVSNPSAYFIKEE